MTDVDVIVLLLFFLSRLLDETVNSFFFFNVVSFFFIVPVGHRTLGTQSHKKLGPDLRITPSDIVE